MIDKDNGKVLNKGRKRAQVGIGATIAHVEMAAAIEGWESNNFFRKRKMITDNLEACKKMQKGNIDLTGKLEELGGHLIKNEIEDAEIGKTNKTTNSRNKLEATT